MSGERRDGSGRRIGVKRLVITRREVFDFIFPPGKYYVPSFYRLYALAMFGPLRNGALFSGYRGEHEVSEQELKSLIEQMQRDDVVKIYTSDGVISKNDLEELLSLPDCKIRHIKHPTKQDVDDMLKTIKIIQLEKEVAYHFDHVHDLFANYHDRVINSFRGTLMGKAKGVKFI